MVGFGFADFQNGDLEILWNSKGDVSGWLEDAATFLARWVVGTLVSESAVLLVLALGVEVGSLIATGGFATGARIIGGTLWLAGSGGTLVALAAEGVASLGSHERRGETGRTAHEDEAGPPSSSSKQPSTPVRRTTRPFDTSTPGTGSPEFVRTQPVRSVTR